MTERSRERGKILVIAAITQTVCAALLLTAGCNGGGSQTNDATAALTAPAATSTASPAADAEEEMPSTIGTTAEKPPDGSASPWAVPGQNATLELIDWQVEPYAVAHGEPLNYSVRIKGQARSVAVQVFGPEVFIVVLDEGATEDGITTWSLTQPAPATASTAYRYYPTAVDLNGLTIAPPYISAASLPFEVT